MKFIEVTMTISGKSMLINLNQVTDIISGNNGPERSGTFITLNNGYTESPEDTYSFKVEESYDQIKNTIKNVVGAGVYTVGK